MPTPRTDVADAVLELLEERAEAESLVRRAMRSFCFGCMLATAVGFVAMVEGGPGTWAVFGSVVVLAGHLAWRFHRVNRLLDGINARLASLDPALLDGPETHSISGDP